MESASPPDRPPGQIEPEREEKKLVCALFVLAFLCASAGPNEWK